MYGLIGKKVKMSQIFNEEGHVVPVTLVQAGPCVVSQIKTTDTDGYNSIQLAFGEKSKRNTNKPTAGHLKKSDVESAKVLAEFKSIDTFEYKLGQKFDASIFNIGEIIDIKSKSKGKGFAGVIKRHNFAMQDATHGNSLAHRAHGSIGQCQTPGRVWKGKKMSGHMGNVQKTVQSLKIVDMDIENNVLYIKGAIPGFNGSEVRVKPSIKKS